MLWKKMERENYSMFMIGCWAIWEHRNKVIFEGAEVDPEKIIKRVRDVACEDAEWRAAAVSKGVEKGRREGERGGGSDGRKLAPVGFVKINVDAGVKEGEGVSTGAVCRNRRGEVVWGMAVMHEQSWDSHIAEAVAVLDGLQEAVDRGRRDVVLESDCLQVVEVLEGKRSGRSEFSLIIDDILALCSSFNSVIWSHTSRINNCVAHSLAHVFPRIIGKTVWTDNLPQIVNNAVVFDISLI
ncbi:uncharacterized protein LOC141655553 [Silene latifolia]|uniref:uncharacterized protein LOC141655553 n=1 Tax=Silene latifolia TaxID=37657 RepID=UPI003D78A0B0